ncbi:alpha-galactosidase [Intrasporangium sp.]|uniref:alpha-galactosidase n=1 Tax=Intrasporangium sp. TaxID=1925024 RepID=UPI0032220338
METSTPSATSATIHLRSGGVSLLLIVRDGALPVAVHWGADIGPQPADLARDLTAAAVPVVGPNAVDVPVAVALVPEHHTGFVGRPGLAGSRDGRAWSPRFVVTDVTCDDRVVTGFAEAGPATVRFECRDDEARLSLELVVALLPSGLVRLRGTVTNHGGPYQLDRLDLALPVPAEAGELLDFAGRWGRERAPQRTAFTVGTHLRENRKGRTGADSAYLLHAGTPGFGFADGEVFALHTAWSGNHTHYAEQLFTGERVLGGGELLLPGEVVLADGESYTTPWVYGSYGRGLDEVARRFHRHLRTRDRKVGTDRPVTLNVWEAVYFDHDLPRLLDLADRAAAVGVERFVLDDGWFGARRDDRRGLGDWVVSQQVWPDGLHPLVDHVRGLGMQFGLWFEPEMVNPDSDTARAHPEWVMSARREWPVESRFQQVLNLGIPEAYAHVRDQMCAILDEYDIGYLKWDHNRDLIEAGTRADGGRPGVHAQTLAFYRLLDELRAAHPWLEIESCSSGGARVDLGVLERTDRVWVSDCIDPLERQHMMRWSTQLVPPEYLGSHIASGRSHTTGRVHDLSFRAGTAVFGHLGIEWDLARATDDEVRQLRDWISFYAAHRRLLMGGDLVRMDGYDPHLLVHGVVAPDRSEAVIAMATVGSLAAVPGPRLRFRGLDPQTRYRLRPLVVGAAPSGLQPPRWWGAGAPAPHATESGGYQPPTLDPAGLAGVGITGAALAGVGVAPPVVHPDQVVLFHATTQGPVPGLVDPSSADPSATLPEPKEDS